MWKFVSMNETHLWRRNYFQETFDGFVSQHACTRLYEIYRRRLKTIKVEKETVLVSKISYVWGSPLISTLAILTTKKHFEDKNAFQYSTLSVRVRLYVALSMHLEVIKSCISNDVFLQICNSVRQTTSHESQKSSACSEDWLCNTQSGPRKQGHRMITDAKK